MKTAKKLIFMILVVAFAFIFAACNDEQEHSHSFVDGSCECGEKDPNYVTPHTHSYSSVVTAPTCTEAGYTTFTCECGDTYKEDGEAALGHTEVVDAAVAATCTEAGKTEGKHCSVCNEVLVAQEEIAALGHKFVDSKCVNCEEQFVAPVGGWTLVTELKDGDNVLIAAPAYNKLLSAEKVSAGSYYNKGVDYTLEDYSNVTDAEIFVVTDNGDGTYTFTSLTGVVIALADSYSSLNNTGNHKSWSLVDKGNGLFLLKNTGRNTYLEWYASKNNWSTYTAGNTKEYELSFYAKGEATDGEHVHNHISSIHEATCTEAGYTAYTCRCGDTYKVDGEAALGHTEVVDAAVAATCTEAGKTEGKHCSVCNEVLVAQEEVAALGHSYKEGTCEVCGDKESSGETEVTKGSADFNTIVPKTANGDSSYTNTYTTTNGWVTKNSAIQAGGVSNSNPQFTVIGPNNTYKAVCLNGKTTAYGSITSPTLNGGLSKLVVKFTKMFTDTELSVTVTVTELSTGNEYTHVIARSLPKDEKYVVYTEEWVLETPVTGDFTIEIVNNCPSKNTGNKDRMTILSIDWEGAVPTHTHEYESTTTATCTAAGVTTYTCSCGDTYTEETEKLGHVDANLDIDCDREGCTSKVAPQAESTLSNFTANNLGSKLSTSSNYYVEGTISDVLDAKNGIFYLDDGTGEKFYFRLPKNEEGVSYASWTVKLVLGDKVRVYGKINKYTTSSAPNGSYYPAIQGGTVTYIEQHPHVFGEPTCFEPGYCECGQAGPAALGHSDLDANGFCDVCEWNMKHQIESINTHYDDVKGTENCTADFVLWQGEEFKVQVDKGTSTINTNGTNYFRVQKNNIFTISSLNGNKIVSITFVPTSSSYVDELQAFLEAAGYTITTNDLEVTINIDSLDTVSITNTSSKVARIASVKIVYEKSAE